MIGFGFTRAALYLNDSLVDPEYGSRYLKVGYVKDGTAHYCFPKNVSEDCRERIFVYNRTDFTNETMSTQYPDSSMLHKIARIQKTWSI